MIKKIELIIFIFIGFILSACSSTEPKTVEIPVPMQCPKPKPIPPAHDYLADLTPLSTAPDFVKACIATRDSYKVTLNYCERTR